MIVVSDTSPIYYLVEIAVADILPRLYGEVVIPPAVLHELRHPRAPTSDWSLDSGLSLDRGELEAIAVAKELQADLLLIDERLGRLAAQRQGLKVAGTLGVILDAASEGLVDFDQTMKSLRRTNFFMSDAMVDALQAEWLRRHRP